MPAQARVVLISALLVLLLTVVNAGVASTITPDLQRAEVLAGLASVGLMLVAVLWTRANPRTAEARELSGEQGLVLRLDLPQNQREELGWGSHMFLTATPAATVMVFWKGEVLLRRGLVRREVFVPGPICQRAIDLQKTVALVNTLLFPGRAEFDSVLENLPAPLVCPIGRDGVVIIGGWSPRCFSRSDERWLEGWCQRLRTTLEDGEAVASIPTQP